MCRRHPDFESDIARVRSPDSDPALLEALVDKHHGDLEIAEAVAANPSCPVDLYRSMCKFGVRTVRENPRRDQRLGSSPGQLGLKRAWQEFWRWKAGATGIRLLFGEFEPLLDKERPEAWRLARLLDYAAPKAMLGYRGARADPRERGAASGRGRRRRDAWSPGVAAFRWTSSRTSRATPR